MEVAMIISHNLLAMNANRQFNITNKNKAKTTEKLSSGYRINRAAVDLLFAIIVLVIRSLTVYLLKSDWSVWTVKFGMVPLGEALAGYQAVMVTAPVGVLGK